MKLCTWGAIAILGLIACSGGENPVTTAENSTSATQLSFAMSRWQTKRDVGSIERALNRTGELSIIAIYNGNATCDGLWDWMSNRGQFERFSRLGNFVVAEALALAKQPLAWMASCYNEFGTQFYVLSVGWTRTMQDYVVHQGDPNQALSELLRLAQKRANPERINMHLFGFSYGGQDALRMSQHVIESNLAKVQTLFTVEAIALEDCPMVRSLAKFFLIERKTPGCLRFPKHYEGAPFLRRIDKVVNWYQEEATYLHSGKTGVPGVEEVAFQAEKMAPMPRYSFLLYPGGTEALGGHLRMQDWGAAYNRFSALLNVSGVDFSPIDAH